MVAIVNIAGQQFKVEAGQKVYVHRLAADKGDKVNFDQVLLLSTDSGATIGTPTVSG
ncbi:MAG: 50S ribosomal protein L21, partial [Saprospiraceae bacterium]